LAYDKSTHTEKANQIVRLLLFKLVSNFVIGFQLGYL